MPTRKVPVDPKWIKPPCQHPDHNPPSMMVFEEGYYEHICPACNHSTRFRVTKPKLVAQPWCAGGCCADHTRGGTL